MQDDSDLPPFCCHMAQMPGRDLCQQLPGGHLPTGSALEDDGHQVPTAPVPLPHTALAHRKITTHDTCLSPDTIPLSRGLLTCQESGKDEVIHLLGTNLCKTSAWPQGEKRLQNLVCAASYGHPNKTCHVFPKSALQRAIPTPPLLWQKQDLTKSCRQTGSSSPK